MNSRDEFHTRALQLADGIDSRLITTEAVLIEIGNVLAKLPWRELAVSALNDLRDDGSVEILSVGPDLFSLAPTRWRRSLLAGVLTPRTHGSGFN
uniref:PIN domain n=1 Tax=Candidatus Kentrum sp. LPFa TaxID=2126335 RepID=A0A450W6D8_9GAMM|nr:MAG: PIN domain [Candidatus Kentron sp. LPFa]